MRLRLLLQNNGSIANWLISWSRSKLKEIFDTYLNARSKCQTLNGFNQEKICQDFRDHELDLFVDEFLMQAWELSQDSVVQMFLRIVADLVLYFQLVPVSLAQIYCSLVQTDAETTLPSPWDPEYIDACSKKWRKDKNLPGVHRMVTSVANEIERVELPRTAIAQAVGTIDLSK